MNLCSNGEPIKNRADLEHLDYLCGQINVIWEHILGHTDAINKAKADQLAQEGANSTLIALSSEIEKTADARQELGTLTDLDKLLPGRKRRNAVAKAYKLRKLRLRNRASSISSALSWLTDLEFPNEVYIAVVSSDNSVRTAIGMHWSHQWPCLNVHKILHDCKDVEQSLHYAVDIAIRMAVQHEKPLLTIYSDLTEIKKYSFDDDIISVVLKPLQSCSSSEAAKMLAQEALAQMDNFIPTSRQRVYVCSLSRPGVCTGCSVFWESGDNRNIKKIFPVDKYSFNRAGLCGCIIALKTAIECKLDSLTICCSDEYPVNCMNSWIKNWINNDWLTSVDTPVRNREELEEVTELCNKLAVEWIHEVSWECHALACVAMRVRR
ncbi:hypothetical protein GJ496_004761 [Pomphorhynchus laevis]|nr:hypothetical protein GJ496_004761 [Pomphorhynchus laevis]